MLQWPRRALVGRERGESENVDWKEARKEA